MGDCTILTDRYCFAALEWHSTTTMKKQRAKKVMSDSLWPMDFAIGLVISVLNLPDGQVLFFGENQIAEGL